VNDDTPPFTNLPPPSTVQAYDLLTRLAELSSDCPRDVRAEIRDSIEPSLRHHVQSVSSKSSLRELTSALDKRLAGMDQRLTSMAVRAPTVLGVIPASIPVFGGHALTWGHVVLALVATVAAVALGVDVVDLLDLPPVDGP